MRVQLFARGQPQRGPQGHLSHLTERLSDRGQRRRQQPGDGGVVEADHAEVLRDGKALKSRCLDHTCRGFVGGSEDGGGTLVHLEQSRSALDPDTVRVITAPRAAANHPNVIELVQTGPSLADIAVGQLSPVAGDGSYRFVVEACRLARDGMVDGIVTAPLNKAAMQAGGHKWPGHTGLLAHEFGVQNFSLVLSAGDLNFFHLTAHVSLQQAIENTTPERTDDILTLAGAFARALNKPNEAIGVCASTRTRARTASSVTKTPTSSSQRSRGHENGASTPTAQSQPTRSSPPAVRGRWNLVIACYHDQGHAPFKAVYGDDGVNITIGLPVVRVSVDHGTAFDIAGKGIAREASLVLSCRRAAELAPGWDRVWQTARQSRLSPPDAPTSC
jgi:4-phospho-D-threonate 3-dehydrogenase / 4-phospho-D-erythronate 3-dehydrogenase